MQADRYRLASEFNLAVFERMVAKIEDPKELRRLAVRLHATILHQQTIYEFICNENGEGFLEGFKSASECDGD